MKKGGRGKGASVGHLIPVLKPHSDSRREVSQVITSSQQHTRKRSQTILKNYFRTLP